MISSLSPNRVVPRVAIRSHRIPLCLAAILSTGCAYVGNHDLAELVGLCLSEAVVYPDLHETTDAVALDMDGDGLDEWVVAASNTLLVLDHDGAEVELVQTREIWDQFVAPPQILTGDFNGDSALQIGLVALNTLVVCEVEGGVVGSCDEFASRPPANQEPGAAGDFDGDGIWDLYDGGGQLYRGTPSGMVLANGEVIASSEDPGVILAGDVDGDGVDDIVMAGSNELLGVQVSVLLGDSATPLATRSDLTLEQFSVSGGSIGDFDGDGFADVLLTHGATTFEERRSVLLTSDGTGALVLEPTPLSGLAGSLRDTQVLEVNGDGAPDLLGWEWDSGSRDLVLVLGDPSGGFQAPARVPNRTPLIRVLGAATDIDGDGRIDVPFHTIENEFAYLTCE